MNEIEAEQEAQVAILVRSRPCRSTRTRGCGKVWMARMGLVVGANRQSYPQFPSFRSRSDKYSLTLEPGTPTSRDFQSAVSAVCQRSNVSESHMSLDVGHSPTIVTRGQRDPYNGDAGKELDERQDEQRSPQPAAVLPR